MPETATLKKAWLVKWRRGWLPRPLIWMLAVTLCGASASLGGLDGAATAGVLSALVAKSASVSDDRPRVVARRSLIERMFPPFSGQMALFLRGAGDLGRTTGSFGVHLGVDDA